MRRQIFKFKKRKVVQLSVPFLIVALLLFACKKEDESEIGLELQGGDEVGSASVDTFKINTYSDFEDSLRSTETARNLLGSYNDPDFGDVQVGFYSQFRLEANDPNFDNNNAVVDSVILSLEYDDYYGKIASQKVEVYRLTEGFTPDQEYYRFSQLNHQSNNLELTGAPYQINFFDETVVGSDTVNPQLRVKLDPSLGQDFISADNNGDLVDNDAFTSYFKGLYIKVDNGNQAIGEGGVMYFDPFSPQSKITMYYRENGVAKTFDFDINENSSRFNAYENDYSGTFVEQVLNNPTKGQEKFYVQSGAMRGGVEFPTLTNLTDSNENIVIVKAELILPIQYFEGGSYAVPNKLILLELQENGVQTFLEDNFNPNHIEGTFNDDNASYNFIITRFVEKIISGEAENSKLRILSPKHYSSVERVVLNGQESDFKSKPSLRVTYTEY